MIFNYVRVSTIEQNTGRQLIDISCDRVYEEKVSAKDTNRPQLNAMLSNLRSGDIVNVHELSRLARNTKDLLDIVDSIMNAGASIYFYKENLRFESGQTSDPFQQLMLSLLGAISAFERDLMLERQREGIAIAKADGRYKGKRSRFSEQDRNEIRRRFSTATNKVKLAKELGVSRQYLYKLVDSN